MGTFVGHFVPGFAITLLGLWHVVNTAQAFFQSGSDNFKARFSFPLKIPFFRLRNLDLVLILCFSILAIITQVLDFPMVKLEFRLDNFEHATMFLQLLVYSGFALFSELMGTSESLFGIIGVLGSSLFGQELFLLHYHSTDHAGIEGQYHWLLQLIVLVSFLAAITVTLSPSCFPASVILGVSMVFQGLWLVNMGFMLWVPKFVPSGCTLQSGLPSHHGDPTVICRSKEADARARALANLQFSWALCTVLVFTASLCLKLASANGSAVKRSAEYQKLQSRTAGDLGLSITIRG